MAQKKYQEAISFYTQAIAMDSQNPVFYANRAAAYSQNSEHEKAIDDSKLALKVDAKYTKAFSRMGYV